MFRCVEAVYRGNRAFGNVGRRLMIVRLLTDLLSQKLKEIGPSPSSPKALGDLLMRWVRVFRVSCSPRTHIEPRSTTSSHRITGTLSRS